MTKPPREYALLFLGMAALVRALVTPTWPAVALAAVVVVAIVAEIALKVRTALAERLDALETRTATVADLASTTAGEVKPLREKMTRIENRPIPR